MKRKKVPEKKIMKPDVIIIGALFLLEVGSFKTFSYSSRRAEFKINKDSKPDGSESNWFRELVKKSIIIPTKNNKKVNKIIFLNLRDSIEK